MARRPCGSPAAYVDRVGLGVGWGIAREVDFSVSEVSSWISGKLRAAAMQAPNGMPAAPQQAAESGAGHQGS